MKNLINLSLISFLILSSCKSDDDNVENIYSGCCETFPVEASLDTGKIFIPNIITPNSNGFNDIFFPFASDGIELINSFKVTNEQGQIVFLNENLSPNVNPEGWNAIDNENNVMSGLFNYEITVTSALGQTKTFTGNVCSFVCQESDFPNENISNCAFSSQHNGIGNWDNALPSNEEECF